MNRIISDEIERLKMKQSRDEISDGAFLAHYNILHRLLVKHPALDYADRYKKERDELLGMVKTLQHFTGCTAEWHSEPCEQAQALLERIKAKNEIPTNPT